MKNVNYKTVIAKIPIEYKNNNCTWQYESGGFTLTRGCRLLNDFDCHPYDGLCMGYKQLLRKTSNGNIERCIECRKQNK